MKSIRTATKLDADEIRYLRLSEYKRAKEFIIIDSSITNWNEHDERNVVVAVWDDTGKAISTMRGGIAKNRKEAEAELECNLPIPDFAFPTLILGGGATRKEYRNSGLNSVLRYYFISSAFDAGINSMLGVVPKDAPRTNIMKSIGYTLLSPNKSWRTNLQFVNPQLVAYLEHSKMATACVKLGKMFDTILKEYTWQGEPIRFNF